MKNFKYLSVFIISFLTAGVLWSIIGFYLPKFPLIYMPKNFSNEFFNINLTKIFTAEEVKKTPKKQSNKNTAITSLKNIKLKAIYNDGKKAFIIINDQGKTVFLDLNQTYKGYKLIKIFNNYVIFEKNAEKYILSFNNKQQTKKHNAKPKNKKIISEKISKKLIRKYKNNFSKIWKEIGIVRINKGYKITYVKKGGIFDKLGLKTGDIIIKINGKKITNDIQAWNLYNNFDKYDYLEIEIKRNNKKKVIEYEID